MRAILLLGAVLCLAGSAHAEAPRPKETADAPLIREDVSWPRTLHDSLGLPEWLDLALEQRTRFEYLDEPFRPGEAGHAEPVPAAHTAARRRGRARRLPLPRRAPGRAHLGRRSRRFHRLDDRQGLVRPALRLVHAPRAVRHEAARGPASRAHEPRLRLAPPRRAQRLSQHHERLRRRAPRARRPSSLAGARVLRAPGAARPELLRDESEGEQRFWGAARGQARRPAELRRLRLRPPRRDHERHLARAPLPHVRRARASAAEGRAMDLRARGDGAARRPHGAARHPGRRDRSRPPGVRGPSRGRLHLAVAWTPRLAGQLEFASGTERRGRRRQRTLRSVVRRAPRRPDRLPACTARSAARTSSRPACASRWRRAPT